MNVQKGGMQSVTKALQVLEAVADAQPVGVGALARQLELPKSTVQRCLVTLGSAGWLRQANRAGGLWSLAPHAWAVGRKATVDLVSAAKEPLERLHALMDETVYLIVRGGSDSVVTERIESTKMVRTSRPLGARKALYATASGRTILALMPDAQVDELLPDQLEPFADSTLITPHALKGILSEIRRDGYALSYRLNEPDVCSIAAPIANHDGEPLASIVVSMPDSRFTDEIVAEHTHNVVQAARQTAHNMGIATEDFVDEEVFYLEPDKSVVKPVEAQ